MGVAECIRILLVDDSPVFRRLAAAALRVVGDFEVDEAEGAREALELVASRWYSVVVVDYLMPGMDGIGFVQSLRAMPRHTDLPAILLVNEDEEYITGEARIAGVDTVLVKPVDPSELRAAVRSLAARPVSGAHDFRGVDAHALLEAFPYPATVLDARHNVVLGNVAFYRQTRANLSDCGVSCITAVHRGHGMPSGCPLVEARSTGEPVERVIEDPVVGRVVVSVLPLDATDADGNRLFLHLARPAD